MDCSIINFNELMIVIYKMDYHVLKLINACKSVNGTFSLLWHNSNLFNTVYKNLYISIINQSLN